MRKILTLFMVIAVSQVLAQKVKSPYQKFGSITVKDLERNVYAIDSSANAVVLSDIGTSEIRGNSEGWFSQHFIRHTVIHILNKNGYDEASISIPLYGNSSSDEKISGFKAVTYNLENGKIIETKLSRTELIKEKVDNNRSLLKFTMPQVKEGSIIEFTYKVISSFISIPDPWYFQSITAPVLWSELNFAMPEFFVYRMSSHGYEPFYINESATKNEKFTVMEPSAHASRSSFDFSSDVKYLRFVVKDAPQLKTEPYTRSVRNHLSRLDFQLAAQRDPLKPFAYRSSWEEIVNNMLESDYFGKHLGTINNWLRDEIKPITKAGETPMQMARDIFAFIRDNYKTTDGYGLYMEGTLRNIFKSKKGSASELNLLLVAMLRYANLQADPVIISTAGHGYAWEHIPMLTSMNYVVALLHIDNQDYFLDCSQGNIGFGKMPLYTYNGFGVVVAKPASYIMLLPDSVSENRRVNFFFSNTDKGYSGSVQKKEGYYASLEIRNEIAKNGQEEYFKEIAKKFPDQLAVGNFRVDKLTSLDEPLLINYDINLAESDQDILYVNPLFGENYTRNPFVSSKRTYPVEMPYVQEEIISVTMHIPDGYDIDELPKPTRVKLDPEGVTEFLYNHSVSDRIISLQSRIKIGKTTFSPDEYDMLREFFNYVTKKQSEHIVFKKIR